MSPTGRFFHHLRLALSLALAPVLFGATPPPFAGPVEAGRLQAPPKKETSGLAASRRTPGLLWTHDDSGGEPVLHAVEENGRRRGSVKLIGVRNEDWEDVAACELDGKPWLLVGDVGDNDAKRPHVVVHALEEPKTEHLIPQGDLSLKPAFSIRIVYPDGPRDCESVAVDAAERMVYLLTKRDPVPRLYRVPFAATSGNRATLAEFVGTVPHIPQPTALQRGIKGHLGRRRAEVCAMDFAADARSAVVLTYGAVLYFEKSPDQSWMQALAQRPQLLPAHDLPQAEAACFSPDGAKIYVASEMSPTLIRYHRR